jgi:hypothetical protein
MKMCSVHPPVLQELVLGALQVDNRESYETWRTKAKAATDAHVSNFRNGSNSSFTQWMNAAIRFRTIRSSCIQWKTMFDWICNSIPISTNTARATGRITWTSGIWSA